MENNRPPAIEGRQELDQFGSAGRSTWLTSQFELTACSVTALVAFAATWISLGRLHQFDYGDSIVPVLVSTQRWTPFYWGSDRFGMLVPLLAAPFHNLLTNLIIQEALTTFAAITSSFLLVRYVLGISPFWFTAAALQNVWLILLVPKPLLFEWFVTQCYGVSFALGFVALIFCESRKWLLAILFILLAHWVNVGACVLLFLLVLVRYLFQKDGRQFITSCLLVLLGASAGWALMHLSQWHETKIIFVPYSQWLSAAVQVLHSTCLQVADHPARFLWFTIVPSIVGTTALLIYSRFRVVAISLTLIFAAILYWLFVSTQVWLKMNLYWPRYLYPSLLLLGIAMAMLVVGPIERFVPQGRILAILATALMVGTAIYSFGKPSVSNMHDILDRQFGRFTADILASHVSVVAGTYWTVWPAVFHANLTLQERGEHRVIYGLTYRAGETLKFWIFQPRLCLAVPDNDSEAADWMRPVNLHVNHVKDYNTIQTFCRP